MKFSLIQNLNLFFFLIISVYGVGQYAPPPGHDGSTAIHADSSIINSWAGNVTLVRGLLNAADSSSGEVTNGLPVYATGAADNQVVSLGDGGMATYALETPLSNDEGFDFAVYENSFSDDFLELAFVEVSSDGEHFVRFPSISLTPTDEQVGPYETLEATYLYNLAGKYRALFGTPFDLAELADSAGIDISEITHIRVKDVVGSLDDAIASYDSQGTKVNDPWPTDFASGGFDLDAVALIHLKSSANAVETFTGNFKVYPNPVANQLILSHSGQVEKVKVYTASGRIVYTEVNPGRRHSFGMNHLKDGLYFVRISAKAKSITKKIVKK